MTKSERYYCEEPMVRTLEEIKNCAQNGKLSCAHKPLINIPLGNIILDELHLMLRVTGRDSYVIHFI